MALYKYKLWCETENSWVYIWKDDSENPPNKCPNDTSHTIDETKTAIEEICDKPKITQDGGQVVSLTYGITPENSQWKGYIFQAKAGQTTFFDIQITTEIRLQGGYYQILNYQDIGWNGLQRDYIEFSIIDKDDVLGLFSQYGLNKENGDILEIKKFVKNAYVLEKDTFIDKYSVFPVLQGLYFRIAYNSVAPSTANDIYFIVTLYWFE